MATNGNFNHQDQYSGPADGSEHASSSSNHDLPKDEVGWYFVEQYYTTLSKSPEKLHLFYGKRSQFVYGMEAEVANVSVGRQAIQERIKQLDFQDCKVRVSNVDSLLSFDNIVIQVIGETSNKKSEEPKKFVQTFVLAKQPSGYFVLNDIWRYINEDVEDDGAEAPRPAGLTTAESDEVPDAELTDPEEDASGPSTNDEPASALDPSAVDRKLEDAGVDKDTVSANGGAEQEVGSDAPNTATPKPEQSEPVASPDFTARELAEEDAKQPEKPKDPTPTPVSVTKAPSPAPAPVAVPSEPEKPAKPMTWASRAAAAAGPKPAVPLPKTATPPAPAHSRTPVPPAAATKAPTAAPQRPEPASQDGPQSGSEWQTAGGDSKRQNRPQSISGPPADKELTMGYVKYVTEKVQDSDLKAALASFGTLTYFDINRMKNCAFVEFATPEGYKAAVAANPHVVNGESIVVEPRRPKATAYGGANYGSGRGNASGRGRGGFEGNRSGSQGTRGGGFTGQARGRGGGATRGKGPSQPANP